MKVHLVGLGKLGLPVALALERAGHTLTGWDVSEQRRRQIELRSVPEDGYEPDVGFLLSRSEIKLVERVPADTEIVLVAVQTPHKPEFEGCVPLDREPEDFDYEALSNALHGVVYDCRTQDLDPLVVVISTCLPGTFDRNLRYLVQPRRLGDGRLLPAIRFAYHPLFIAMGQVISDFRNPEFVLIGTDGGEMPRELRDLYASLYPSDERSAAQIAYSRATNPTAARLLEVPEIRCMSITSAELTKVAYNAWLGYKLMLTNGLAELSDRVGANVDDVMGTLKLATDRLVSTRYMDAGMGDGGGCHPRDQIALSHIARREGLSSDTFSVVIRQREQHAKWLADLWCDEADRTALTMVMLGEAYKPNSPLKTGSASRLVLHFVRARGREVRVLDEHPGWMLLGPQSDWPVPHCFFLGTPHDWTRDFPLAGVLVDPWGIRPDVDGLEIIRPGRRA